MQKHLLQAQAEEKARKQKRAKLVSEPTRILTKIVTPMTELTAMMGDAQVVALAPKHFVGNAVVERRQIFAFLLVLPSSTSFFVSSSTFSSTSTTSSTRTCSPSQPPARTLHDYRAHSQPPSLIVSMRVAATR